MGDVIDMTRHLVAGDKAPVDPGNIATWGLTVDSDGSLVISVVKREGGSQLFFLDHSLVDQFEAAVCTAAQHSRFLTGG